MEKPSTSVLKYLRETPLILLYSAVGAIGMTWFSCNECRYSPKLYAIVASFSAIVWFVLWVGNGMISNYFGCTISWVKHPVRRLVVGVVSTLAFSVTAVYVSLISFSAAFHINFGDHMRVIQYSVVITFIISLFLHSREFLKNWKQSAIDAERFEKESLRAQYESLRHQVNPHFLFNSLNALTNLVYEDADKAAKFIKQLSEVYRYLLDTRELDVVEIGEELKFLRSYIFLQEIRFNNNLTVKIEIESLKTSLPPLALQLLVENAVKHNIVSREQPLVVRLFEENGFIVVENNLQIKSEPEETFSGLGLQNIQKRYSFLTDRAIVIEATSGKFIVRLPILNA